MRIRHYRLRVDLHRQFQSLSQTQQRQVIYQVLTGQHLIINYLQLYQQAKFGLVMEQMLLQLNS